jgi:hypothetical protein
MTKLGLNFSENTTGKNAGTTGNGVQVQTTKDSPDWIKGLLGEGGLSNFYTDQNGFITFEAGSTKNQGPSYYTLATDDRGLSGVFEHSADGTTKLTGGDYGFNAGAVQLLVNKGEQAQQQIVFAQAQAQQALKVQQAQAQAQIVAQQSHPSATPQPQTVNPQKTVSPQLPTFNPQPKTFNPQQTINGFNLNQSGSGGIKLGNL